MEGGEQDQNSFDVDRKIEEIMVSAEGHTDDQGEIRPELRQQEAENVVSKFGTTNYILERRGVPEETRSKFLRKGLEAVFDKFPEQKDELKAKINGDPKNFYAYNIFAPALKEIEAEADNQ